MASKSKVAKIKPVEEHEDRKTSQQEAVGDAAHELVFAVVGHVGSGTSEIANQLKSALEDMQVNGESVDVEIIKAKSFMNDWAEKHSMDKPDVSGVELVKWYQDIGDAMRKEEEDYSVIARHFALAVRELRGDKTGQKTSGSEPVMPDGSPRAYILDSIRHPDEVQLLRHVYQDAFVLIGVVCEEKVRIERLAAKHSDGGADNCKELMSRDAKAGPRHGQRTGDAFHMADFFIDNSINRTLNEGGQSESNPDWKIVPKLERLIKILSHSEVIRPAIDETAMHHAYSAQLRSACLSRQVGASLVDEGGNLLASGTNEVPRAGGGVYGELHENSPNHREKDYRCAFRDTKYCSNTREQNEIVAETVDAIESIVNLESKEKERVISLLKGGRVGALLEFSRAVHAEMDALLSAARASQKISGSRLFVTTFPCHFCARHIVSAGVDEVQYIEPYPKSAALKLHSDAICVKWVGWQAPSEGGDHVLFRPFSGVAPRMYRRAFQQSRELKDKTSGDFQIANTRWASPWHLAKSSYVTLEAKLIT